MEATGHNCLQLRSGEAQITCRDRTHGEYLLSCYLLNVDKLPFSFNRIDLPPYESYQELRDKLIKALEGAGTFGGVD